MHIKRCHQQHLVLCSNLDWRNKSARILKLTLRAWPVCRGLPASDCWVLGAEGRLEATKAFAWRWVGSWDTPIDRWVWRRAPHKTCDSHDHSGRRTASYPTTIMSNVRVSAASYKIKNSTTSCKMSVAYGFSAQSYMSTSTKCDCCDVHCMSAWYTRAQNDHAL